MQTEELENYTQPLLTAAMRKCGRIEDAQDLAQETLLAALSYMKRGGRIEDIRAWLLTVLHRKFNDLLRRTYREDSVSIGPDFDLPDEGALPDFEDEEAEEVRRAGTSVRLPWRWASRRGRSSAGVNQYPAPIVLII